MVISASCAILKLSLRQSTIRPMSHSDNSDGVPPPMYTLSTSPVSPAVGSDLYLADKRRGILGQYLTVPHPNERKSQYLHFLAQNGI